MKGFAFVSATLLALLTLKAQQPPEPFDLPDPLDQNVKTGPAIGERIPPFRAIDQNGRWLDFDGIKGPKGAVLLFFRSADW